MTKSNKSAINMLTVIEPWLEIAMGKNQKIEKQRRAGPDFFPVTISEDWKMNDTYRQVGQKKDGLSQSVETGIDITDIIDAFQFYALLVDEDHRILRINKAGIEKLGLKKDEIIGGYCHEVLHGTNDPFQGCPLEEAVKGNTAVERDLFDPASGTWVRSMVYPVGKETRDGKKIYFLTAMVINEIELMEETLRGSEEKYRHLFGNLNDAIFLADTETGEIIETNHQGTVLLGRSHDEIVGMHQSELHPPGKAEEYKRIFAKHVKRERVADYDGEVIRKDGTIVPVSISASTLTVSGRCLIMGLFRDITERQEMLERLGVANRLASIGELASGIAHELNNPLTGIIGFAELLLEENVSDDIKERIAIIHHEAKHAAKVMMNLLTFARKHKQSKKPVNINSTIATVLGLRAYEQRVNNIKVETRFADLPEIVADSFQLQQVFLNIIINAEFFMTEANKKGTLTITSEKTDGIIRITFADDGPGIPEENIGCLFDPFFSTKTAGRGTGLGLGICRGIVAEYGGRIYAESEPGKGATFIVELPIEVVSDDELWIECKEDSAG